MADTDTNMHVPDEIVDNILFRLPTKSLSRFRCVSNHWNRLISNPDFMKSLSRRKIFLPARRRCQTIEKVVSGENITTGYRMVRAGSPFQDARSVTVVGTTNGLVLLVLNVLSSADMILYNPLTRVFKEVPPPLYIYQNLAFGFGHGATQDDLKIVKLGVYHCDMSLSWGVFSVKNRTWSPMSESIGHYEFSDYGSTFLNGFLYWRVLKDHSSALVLALDIKEMTLLEIKVPVYTMFDDTTMGTINGCLCLICPKGGSSDKYQLLVMKDHDIWEPHLKGCSTSTLSRMNCDTFRAMCILDEGKVIIKNRDENTFLILDLVKDSSEPILVCTDFNQKKAKQAIEYVESFCHI